MRPYTALSIAAAALLSACAADIEVKGTANALVGQSRQTLIATLGEPTTAYTDKGVPHLLYLRESSAVVPGIAHVQCAGSVCLGRAIPPSQTFKSCAVAFRLEGETVAGVETYGACK